MLLSIIVPCYNEENTIVQIIDSIYLALKDFSFEIIVVNDASTDSTPLLLTQLNKKYHDLLVINHIANKGKTSGIISALEFCSGEYTIIQDADLEYQPNDIPKLLNVINNTVHAVYGSRHKNTKSQFIYTHYLIGGHALTWLTNLLYSIHITDVTTGYKLIRTGLMKQLILNKSSRFGFCTEVTAQLARNKTVIHEVSIDYTPRTFAEGKKIRPKDAIDLAWILVKYRFKKVLPLIEMA
jgi:dolichol-phosphate mannosyltransferase